jgi:hypothetical protein
MSTTEREEDAKSWLRKERQEMAEYLAATRGGDPDDYMEELKDGNDYEVAKAHLEKQGYAEEASHDYRSADGNTLLYRSVRFRHRHVKTNKRFLQCHIHPRLRGSWCLGAGPVKVPYNWPELVKRTTVKAADGIPAFITPTMKEQLRGLGHSKEDLKEMKPAEAVKILREAGLMAKTSAPETVWFCEGESNADYAAKQYGILTTTVAGQKWSRDAAEAFRGMDVIILEDDDAQGWENAANAVKNLTGVAKSIRVVRLPGLKPGEHDIVDWGKAGHTKEELLALAEKAPRLGLRDEPYDFPAEADLAMYDWTYGEHLLRGEVSATVAPGDTGKSTLSIAEALAMAAGRDILGVTVLTPLRVLLISLEDKRAVVAKRVAAAMKKHGVTKEEISGRLFIVGKGELKMRLAGQTRSGTVKRDEDAIHKLVAYARRHKIDVISVDPFVRAHGVSENDNEAITAVIECFEDVADRANCAVSLWHHTRKGNGTAMTVESARGASAFKDSCRSLRVLEPMTKEEADRLGVLGWCYFREFSGKLNYAPPPERSSWYEKASVQLENGFRPGGDLFGDSIGVAVKWQHPGADAAVVLSAETIEAILKEVMAGSWREDLRAGMWVGKAVAQVLGLDAQDKKDQLKIKGVIRELKARRILKAETRQDPKRREDFVFTIVA